ncbi:hypothetical protein [Phreatobacter stygius]|uniref:Phage tail protein n=1 Tax=Phreatobacter stygius TaxID=1940610 RepID=A0A4D7B5X5_9HYPH|nr:hypothetical protein [Phreatobacter stygius]QCI65520.1 hypothetical protein E8M01_15690 [Phreatobacter stygius]
MARVITTGDELLDQLIWRELAPRPADQRRLYAAALALNPHLLAEPGRLPAGLPVNLPARPDPAAKTPAPMLRIFG